MSGRGQGDSRPALHLPPEQVKDARSLLSWQQSDLADAVGVSNGAISRFQRGDRISQGTRRAIATALSDAGVVVDDRGHVSRLQQA